MIINVHFFFSISLHNIDWSLFLIRTVPINVFCESRVSFSIELGLSTVLHTDVQLMTDSYHFHKIRGYCTWHRLHLMEDCLTVEKSSVNGELSEPAVFGSSRTSLFPFGDDLVKYLPQRKGRHSRTSRIIPIKLLGWGGPWIFLNQKKIEIEAVKLYLIMISRCCGYTDSIRNELPLSASSAS